MGMRSKLRSELGEEKIIKVIREGHISDEILHCILKTRTIILTGEIDIDLIEGKVQELLYLQAKGNEPIRLILNSVGGEVYAGLLLYNTVKDLVRGGIDVIIEANGLAASMGCIILQAGSRRKAHWGTRILAHEISSWTWGKVSEMEDQVEEIRKVNSLLRDIIATRTGRDRGEIDKMWSKKDLWFSADEALDFNLIDEVIR